MEKRKKLRKPRVQILLIATLLAVGLVFGFIFAYIEIATGTTDSLILDFVNGKIVLDTEDREQLTQQIINWTLASDVVNDLIAERDYTIDVTLAQSIQRIEEFITNDSARRIYIAFDYTAIVTLTFEDGSGYNIPVNWEHWTIGEPEYSDNVVPPDPTIRIGPPTTRER